MSKVWSSLAFCLAVEIFYSQSAWSDEPAAAVSTSENFVIRTSDTGPLAAKVATWCESLRHELAVKWCGTNLPAWNPRCEIYIHSSNRDYLQAVGPLGASTQGSSLIQYTLGGASTRRIDLLVDAHGAMQALPHELTHIVLADSFGGPPPQWLDEGAAMLVDTPHKRSLHQRDCRLALGDGTALPLKALFELEQFTSAAQMPAFYGQSESLIRFFCQRGNLEKITRLGLDAQQHGYDFALRTHYQIDGIRELEQLWKSFEYTRAADQASTAITVVSYRP